MPLLTGYLILAPQILWKNDIKYLEDIINHKMRYFKDLEYISLRSLQKNKVNVA